MHGIQTITDGIELHDDHVARTRPRAVVVGGGYIGLELAEAMNQRGMTVTIVEAAPQPMSTLDPDMGTLVAERSAASASNCGPTRRSTGFETDEDGHVRAVVTANGTLPADIVVLGLGVEP